MTRNTRNYAKGGSIDIRPVQAAFVGGNIDPPADSPDDSDEYRPPEDEDGGRFGSAPADVDSIVDMAPTDTQDKSSPLTKVPARETGDNISWRPHKVQKAGEDA